MFILLSIFLIILFFFLFVKCCNYSSSDYFLFLLVFLLLFDVFLDLKEIILLFLLLNYILLFLCSIDPLNELIVIQFQSILQPKSNRFFQGQLLTLSQEFQKFSSHTAEDADLPRNQTKSTK